MGKLYLLLLSLLNTLQGLAQSDLNDSFVSESGYLILALGKHRYYSRRLEWGQFYKESVVEYSSGRTLEEFIRIHQHSFLYVGYDSSGKEICKGILLLDSTRIQTDTFYIPDTELDPDLSKGIMKKFMNHNYSLTKDGFWREENAEGREESGRYLNGRRTGIWKIGEFTRCNGYPNYCPFPWKVFKLDRTENYTDGIVDTTYSTDYTLEKIWPLLQGKWNCVFDMSLREQLYFTKIEITSAPVRLNFIDTLNFVMKEERYLGSKTRKWSFKNRILTIHSDESEQDYSIVFIAAEELYLAPGERRERKR